MAATMRFLVISLVAAQRCAGHSLVPLCIAEQCSAEAKAFGGDAYTKALANCTVENFGPCAKDAWDCLGNPSCRSVLECAPNVFTTCKDDIWKMLTDPAEREKLMCVASCMKDGKISPFCVTAKCGKAAIECVFDKTCLGAALCPTKALLGCSKPAFECIFGHDGTCRKNLECLAHGVTTCAAPAVNILTDTKIASFVACAGGKCPHPVTDKAADMASVITEIAEPTAPISILSNITLAEPHGTATQLLCMAAKCSSKALKILADQDMKDLLFCAMKADLPKLCTSVWDCLGDKTCSNDLTCMTAPFNSCKEDMWHVLTNAGERQRIEQTATCLRKCEKDHKDNLIDASFCVLDTCSESVISCWRDDTCRKAVKCIPNTLEQCAIPLLDAYNHEQLFQNSAKCLGRGLEYCGRAAVEMLRDQNIAEAVQCASQCTRTPDGEDSVVVV